jgi:hypothetical protein
MISIELDTDRVAQVAGRLTAEGAQSFHDLLDRCARENVRDIQLRLPAKPSEDFERVLRKVLARPFRFSGWFRAMPTLSLAELFISAGHRITIAPAIRPDGLRLRDVLMGSAFASGAPWQVSLFLALPAPPPNLARELDGLQARKGTSLTLGLGWTGPETGPTEMTAAAEKEWREIALAMASWWTERGVTVRFACGLPLCLFSTEQLGELALLKVRVPLALCTASPVFSLDGRVRACPRFPAAGWAAAPAGVPLREIAGQLIGSASFFAAFCNRAGEQSCRSLATGACGGGCIAQNALAWHREGGVGKIPTGGAALISSPLEAEGQSPAPPGEAASEVLGGPIDGRR